MSADRKTFLWILIGLPVGLVVAAAMTMHIDDKQQRVDQGKLIVGVVMAVLPFVGEPILKKLHGWWSRIRF